MWVRDGHGFVKLQTIKDLLSFTKQIEQVLSAHAPCTFIKKCTKKKLVVDASQVHTAHYNFALSLHCAIQSVISVGHTFSYTKSD